MDFSIPNALTEDFERFKEFIKAHVKPHLTGSGFWIRHISALYDVQSTMLIKIWYWVPEIATK